MLALPSAMPRARSALSRSDVAPSAQAMQLRRFLQALDALAAAALLRELGVLLYNHRIAQWRVLVDISDELLDAATLPARRRLTARWLAK